MATSSLYFCFAAPGIERLRSSSSMPRHRHLRAFATVILSGIYEEAGYGGRVRAKAGDVLVHPALDSHENKMITAGVKLIRLDLYGDWKNGGLYRPNDIDGLARTAEKDLAEASRRLAYSLGAPIPLAGRANDWPDLLHADMVRDPSIEIGAWAEMHDLASETVSRGFAMAYGVKPSVMRAELRARLAWLRVLKGYECLSDIAMDTGFSDQAHMTRWIHRITGSTPAVWRRNQAMCGPKVATQTSIPVSANRHMIVASNSSSQLG